VLYRLGQIVMLHYSCNVLVVFSWQSFSLHVAWLFDKPCWVDTVDLHAVEELVLFVFKFGAVSSHIFLLAKFELIKDWDCFVILKFTGNVLIPEIFVSLYNVRWVDAPPFFLQKHCEFVVGNMICPVFIQVSEKHCDVLEAYLDPHVLNCLSKFI